MKKIALIVLLLSVLALGGLIVYAMQPTPSKAPRVALVSPSTAATATAAAATSTPTAPPAATAEEEDGLPLLVNATNPLPEGFAPTEIINLYEQKRHFRLATADIELERAVFDAANEMFLAAEKDGLDGFIFTSGYRTWEKQQEIYDETTDGTAALPGTSEHQTGLAFDVTAYYDDALGFSGTPQYAWLLAHSTEYGFIERYPKGKEDVTGYPWEPWHYRYVGKEIAAEIHEKGWTLEEYIDAQSD